MAEVLVTGASRGIGLAFTEHYLAGGDRVFACCRAPAAAARLQELAAEHPALTVVPMDVTEPDQVDAARDLVAARCGGGLDLLINNAGILRSVASFRDVEERDFLDSMRVNALAPLRVIRAFEGLLRGGRRPRIVNLTAPVRPIAEIARAAQHTYLASRYALNALTRMVAIELADSGIVTVALWPGYIRTDMNGHAADAEPAAEAVPKAAAVIAASTADDNGWCLLPDGTRS